MGKTYSAGDQLPATELTEIVKTTGLFATATGSSNAYQISVTPTPTSYVAGDTFTFKANFDNTGATTLNVNSLGAKTIKKDVDQDLEAKDIKNGQIVRVFYDGTNFQLQTGSSDLIKIFTANKDLNAGDFVGVAYDGVGVNKAFDPVFDLALTSDYSSDNHQFIELDDNKILAVYATGASELSAKVGIVDFSDNSVAWGTEETVSSAVYLPHQIQRWDVVKLDTDKFAVLFANSSNKKLGKVIGGTVDNDDEITMGTETTFFTQVSYDFSNIDADQIETDKIIVFSGFSNSSKVPNLIAITFSGTTATIGTAVNTSSNFHNTSGFNIVKKLDTDKFIAWAKNYAVVGTISGTTITKGSEVNVAYTADDSSTLLKINTTKVLIQGTQSSGKILTISGTTITAGANNGFTSGVPYKVNSDTEIISVYTNGTKYRLTEDSGTITEEVISNSVSGVSFNPYTKTKNRLVEFSDGNIMAFDYIDTSTYRVLTDKLSSTFIGIVQASVSEGEDVPILISGVDSNQSGLIAGQCYYLNQSTLQLEVASGTIDAQELSTFMKAISDTEVLIK